VARMGERRGVYKILVGKREGKSPLGRNRRRWENNIELCFQAAGWVDGLSGYSKCSKDLHIP
jgi:hypothetical protein